jgi:hypothetical protein
MLLLLKDDFVSHVFLPGIQGSFGEGIESVPGWRGEELDKLVLKTWSTSCPTKFLILPSYVGLFLIEQAVFTKKILETLPSKERS